MQKANVQQRGKKCEWNTISHSKNYCGYFTIIWIWMECSLSYIISCKLFKLFSLIKYANWKHQRMKGMWNSCGFFVVKLFGIFSNSEEWGKRFACIFFWLWEGKKAKRCELSIDGKSSGKSGNGEIGEVREQRARQEGTD